MGMVGGKEFMPRTEVGGCEEIRKQKGEKGGKDFMGGVGGIEKNF